MLKFYGYKKCGTSRKAEKFLSDHQIDYQFIDITVEPPEKNELEQIIAQSQQPLRKFFNTSGGLYREMKLKDKLKDMSEAEMVDLLSQHGKLIKRPLVSDGAKSTVGFNEETFRQAWLGL